LLTQILLFYCWILSLRNSSWKILSIAKCSEASIRWLRASQELPIPSPTFVHCIVWWSLDPKLLSSLYGTIHRYTLVLFRFRQMLLILSWAFKIRCLLPVILMCTCSEKKRSENRDSGRCYKTLYTCRRLVKNMNRTTTTKNYIFVARLSCLIKRWFSKWCFGAVPWFFWPVGHWI